MTREEFYKLTDILNTEVLGNFMHGGEADELIAMFKEAVEHSNILEQEELISNPINFEQELYKAFGQVKDFTLGMRIAKWFYDMGKNSQEPVSEELEEASLRASIIRGQYIPKEYLDEYPYNAYAQSMFKRGAKWQKAKLMKDATEVTVHIDAGGYPYTQEIELYDYKKDVPLAKEGDKYKVILIKED